MNQLPPFRIEPHFEAPWIKRIEKFDTSVFPDCYTMEREWHIRKGFLRHINVVHVHHDPRCRFSVLRIREEHGELIAEELLQE